MLYCICRFAFLQPWHKLKKLSCFGLIIDKLHVSMCVCVCVCVFYWHKHTDLPLVCEMRVDFVDHTASTDTWGHRFHPDSYLGQAYDILNTKTRLIKQHLLCKQAINLSLMHVKYLSPPRLWSVGYSWYVVWYNGVTPLEKVSHSSTPKLHTSLSVVYRPDEPAEAVLRHKPSVRTSGTQCRLVQDTYSVSYLIGRTV